MTESTQRDPIDSQFPRIVSRQSPKIMIERPILSTQCCALKTGSIAPAPRSPFYMPMFMQSKKYAVIEVKLGTFVTWDSFWGRKFCELSFNLCLFPCAQLSHLKNFALARVSRIFHFAQTDVQFSAKRSAANKKPVFIRVIKSRENYFVYALVFCIHYIFFILHRNYWR